MHRTNIVASLLVALFAVASAGCQKGLHATMGEFGFKTLTPPQTNWEVGSVVEQDRIAPTLRVSPSIAGVPRGNIVLSSTVPDVKKTHSNKLDLDVGVSIDPGIKVGLKNAGVQAYSVIATGNRIERIAIDQYRRDVFPHLASYSAQYWSKPLNELRLMYLHEVWLADSLEYEFTWDGSVGTDIDLSAVVEIPIDLKASYSWKSKTVLVYKPAGRNEPLCLGYKSRPISPGSDGQPVLFSTGPAGQVPTDVARFDPWGTDR